MDRDGPSIPDWERDEPGATWARLQLRRLLARARRRRLLIAVMTLGAAGGAAVLVWRRPALPTARAMVRVLDPAGGDRHAARDLRAMVKEVALAPARVVEVLRKHRLVTPDADPVEALGRFKNSIEHDVEVNQTIALLPQRDRPQSAYVVIKVRMPDAELGALLARSLGQLVVDTFMHARTSQNEDQDRALALTADELRRDIARRGERLTRAMATPDPALLYRVQIARKEIAAREARLAKVERTRAQGQAALRAEEEGMGTEAVLLDGQIDEVTPPFTRMLMAAIGTLAGAFPVFVILVGAFDPRVYTPADVAHMGLPTLGLVTGLLGKGRAEASGRSPTIPSSAPSPA